MNSIGSKIQALRKNKKLTQSDLANALSITTQSISKWENQVSAPDISLLPEIARYFGITIDELFDYKLNIPNYKEQFIRFMVDNDVLQFGTFVLDNGRISPYYINTANYNIASQIAKLGTFYAECYVENNVKSDILISSTAKEIPLTVATATALFYKYGFDITYGTMDYKKSIPKNHVTIIKDTITSGKNLISTIENIVSSGEIVSDVIISVDRMESRDESDRLALKEIEEKHNINIHAIVTLDDIIAAIENNIINYADHLAPLKEYKKKFGGT